MSDEIQQQIDKCLDEERALFSSRFKVLKVIVAVASVMALGGLGFFFYKSGSVVLDLLERPQFYAFLIVGTVTAVIVEYFMQKTIERNREDLRALIFLVFSALSLAILVIGGLVLF